MAVTFQLPVKIEEALRRQLANLDQAAKEALLVDMYRQRKLTHHELGNALGLSRMETDGLLKRHEVFWSRPPRMSSGKASRCARLVMIMAANHRVLNRRPRSG